jgi:hypothetical protein
MDDLMLDYEPLTIKAMKNFILLTALLLLSLCVSGQDNAETDIPSATVTLGKRHNITFSYAGGSLNNIRESLQAEPRPIVKEGQYGFSMVGRNVPHYSGMFTLAYNFKLVRRLEIGVACSYEQSRETWTIYDNPAGQHDKIQRNHYLY